MSHNTERSKESVTSENNQQIPEIKYCLYARKSMEAEERQALSIDSQLKEMWLIAERDKIKVVATRTEAHSAKTVGQRVVFNQIIKEIKEGEYNGILTWAPDRLSRNAGDLGQLIDLMDNKKLLEIRTYNQVFANSPNEKFLLMILGSQAKLENDNRGINVKRGLRASVEKGFWPGLAPMGYKNLYRTDKPGRLKIDPARGYVIKIMFEKAASGWAHRRIRRWLKDDMEFVSPWGNHLSLSTVQRILTNPFYYGDFEYPRGSGNWYKGKHTPIISKELFDKVQSELRKRKYQTRVFRHDFAFTRFIRCDLCGSTISASERFKALKDGSISRYVYYCCSRVRDSYCPARCIREDHLIQQLGKIIDNLTIDELGLRGQFDTEVERMYRFHRDVMGQPAKYESQQQHDLDIKKYVKYILANGTIEEKRHALSGLRSQLILKDKHVHLNNKFSTDT